jgi:hypothetical protein
MKDPWTEALRERLMEDKGVDLSPNAGIRDPRAERPTGEPEPDEIPLTLPQNPVADPIEEPVKRSSQGKKLMAEVRANPTGIDPRTINPDPNAEPRPSGAPPPRRGGWV